MARQMMDVALSETEDISISNGDFVAVESTAQHQRQLILNNKGDFKQNPNSCVGAFDYLDDDTYADLMRAISIEFTKDGMDVVSVQLMPNGIINTDAYYK